MPLGNSVAGYFLAGLLPILYNLIPNPVLFGWFWTHRGTPVPSNIERKAYKVGLFIPFFAQGILLVVLRELISRSNFDVGATPSGMQYVALDVGFGLLAGLAWLALYMAVFFVFPPDLAQLSRNWAVQVGCAYWLTLSLTSAIIEELWRAFCLSSLAPHGIPTAVAVTSIAFGMGHPRPPGRAISMTLFAIYAAALFLATRSLLLIMFAHFTLNAAVFALIRRKTRSIRR